MGQLGHFIRDIFVGSTSITANIDHFSKEPVNNIQTHRRRRPKNHFACTDMNLSNRSTSLPQSLKIEKSKHAQLIENQTRELGSNDHLMISLVKSIGT